MLLRHALNLKWTNVPVLICTLFVVVGACSGAYALRNCANNSSKYNTKFVCTNCVCARKHCTVDVLFLQSVVGCVCVCVNDLRPLLPAPWRLICSPISRPPNHPHPNEYAAQLHAIETTRWWFYGVCVWDGRRPESGHITTRIKTDDTQKTHTHTRVRAPSHPHQHHIKWLGALTNTQHMQ